MSERQTVPGPAVDQEEARPKVQQSRIQFPYYDLRDAVTVAEAIQNEGGGVWSREQLSAILGHKSVRSGAFHSRVAGAIMFGLVERVSGSKLRVTKRGAAIVAPVDENLALRAKVEAFLDVELFREVYARFRSSTLPSDVGLQNLFETEYRMVKSRRAATVGVMRRSAEYAGFFKMGGSSRMIEPVSLPDRPEADSAGESASNQSRQVGDGRGNGTGGGPIQNVRDVHPAILGLIRDLPTPGTALSESKRKKFIAAFTAAVDFIYPEEDS